MLKKIIPENTGPIPNVEVDFSPRLNVLTGDNCLGKSFLLDIAWWSLTRKWPLGSHSTDHFIAKSSNTGQAYEWSNYRLSCLGANRSKNRFDDVLDPF